MTGPGKNIKDELKIVVEYFTDLNKRGVGRYIIHTEITINYDAVVFSNRVAIDNNRQLDSVMLGAFSGPNTMIRNYNFMV